MIETHHSLFAILFSDKHSFYISVSYGFFFLCLLFMTIYGYFKQKELKQDILDMHKLNQFKTNPSQIKNKNES